MIKNFIYLDEEKMYSLSSQLFEGITEYVLKESASSNHESETQKGPLGSGKVLADVIISSNKATEKKFFHDYSFTLFESHLLSEGKILDIADAELFLNDIKPQITNFSFIRVKAKATFNDVNKILELFSEFNSIGEALTYAQTFNQIDQISAQLAQVTDKNQKASLETQKKKLTDFKSLAKTTGLYQDPKLLSNLCLLTKYGFSDQFEITQSKGEILFTSCLKRDFLRESEELLVKKYSRKTEKEIVILGMISQAFSSNQAKPNDNIDYPNMKAGILNIVEHLTEIENSISGKQENEIVIDPIAVYFEV